MKSRMPPRSRLMRSGRARPALNEVPSPVTTTAAASDRARSAKAFSRSLRSAADIALARPPTRRTSATESIRLTSMPMGLNLSDVVCAGAVHHRDDFDHDDDHRGVCDPDLLALGLGGTNMMSMLWAVAMGRRAVGVEMRGDPFLGV